MASIAPKLADQAECMFRSVAIARRPKSEVAQKNHCSTAAAAVLLQQQ
jgi:hypothetical protein